MIIENRYIFCSKLPLMAVLDLFFYIQKIKKKLSTASCGMNLKGLYQKIEKIPPSTPPHKFVEKETLEHPREF
jgi:hypothetical protein